MLGPLPKGEVELAQGDIDLEKKYPGHGGGTVQWEPYLQEETSGNQFGEAPVDLDGRFGGVDQTEAYAYGIVRSDRERDAMMAVGSDDSITVWVNGEKMLDRDVSRAAEPDQNFARVHLK